MGRHLSCFHHLAIVFDAAANVFTQTSALTPTLDYSGCIPGSCTAGP